MTVRPATNNPAVAELALRLNLTSAHAAAVIEATGAPKRRVMHCINELAKSSLDGFDALDASGIATAARWLADTTKQFTKGLARQDAEIYSALANAVERGEQA